MDTSKIKRYAPAARQQFIATFTQQAARYGISVAAIEPVEIKGDLALIGDQVFPARINPAREKLVKQVEQQGFNALIEQLAYTWFNRLCALRFMELKGYLDHGRRVLSHPEQAGGLQILDDCLDIDDVDLPGLDQSWVRDLKLDGTQDEALYRGLLLAQCHALHEAMPFLFEAVDDAAELLLPDNLTKTDSLIRGLVEAIPESDWEQVEVIGWLYQFYIAERKDEVIGKVVKSADIPAATQLFTPNWIVQYLVQNSLGRQWLQTYPDSPLKAAMPYYIEPAEQTDEVVAQLEALTPQQLDPEQLKVLDPACGSGHILIEAYNVLRVIYEERGFRRRDIPALILEHNLFGLDIDDRAAQLAGFSLMMMARNDDRRIFERGVRPQVYAMQASDGLDLAVLWRSLNLNQDWQQGTGLDLFDNQQLAIGDASSDPKYQLLLEVVGWFREAKTFGSLIDVPAERLEGVLELQVTLTELVEQGDTQQRPAAQVLLPLVQQAVVLARRYDAVVANPPYMGSKGMNATLKAFAKKRYPNSKADLFAMFMERAFELLTATGFNAQVNMQAWMFLSSYERLRELLLDTKTIHTLMHIGYNSFPELNSKVVQCVAFSMQNSSINNIKGKYINLNSAPQSANKDSVFLNSDSSIVFHPLQSEFKKIPGSPFSYWVPNAVYVSFSNMKIKDYMKPKQGTSTGDDEEFVRSWLEVDFDEIGFSFKNIDEALFSGKKFFPLDKGGSFKKWYGNNEKIIKMGGVHYKKLSSMGNFLPSKDKYFEKGITWSKITSGFFSPRYDDYGFVFSSVGLKGFPSVKNELYILGFMSSTVMNYLIRIVSPTLSIISGDLEKIPVILNEDNFDLISRNASSLLILARRDWDSFETSWDFQQNPLVVDGRNPQKTQTTYTEWQKTNQHAITETQRLEEENNKLFINAYGLQDELTPEVPIEQITLTVNPRYRYGGKATDADLANRFQSDTSAEFISYAIGCMMGRYRLDIPGLIYAHSGNEDFQTIYTAEQGTTENPYPADNDGIIPLNDQEWFEDDATNRFRDFIKVAWDESKLGENLAFVAESLTLHAIKPKANEDSLATIRRYLSTRFYKDHRTTYKKRPIYWLFSSGKQKAFECLVYLHRYNAGTLARMRTEYVIPLTAKLNTYVDKLEQDKDASTTTTEIKRLEKEISKLHKQQAELSQFDEKLRHFADQRIELDLDDGVKVNYGKFGDLLAEVKAVTGKKAKVIK